MSTKLSKNETQKSLHLNNESNETKSEARLNRSHSVIKTARNELRSDPVFLKELICYKLEKIKRRIMFLKMETNRFDKKLDEISQSVNFMEFDINNT